MIIGPRGCGAFEFYDEAKKVPEYDKLKFENAVRDLTIYGPREQGRYELTPHAKKVLWIIVGPPPEHPEYASWWRGRMVSVRLMREENKEPEFAYEPPMPIPDEKPVEEPPKKPRARKKKVG